MTFQHSSLNDANCPGTASEQGVAGWSPTDAGPIIAVTDRAYVQPGYNVVIEPLINDIGSNLSITSASLRDPTRGTIEFDGTTVTFTPASVYGGLECGESYAVTIDYSIADNLENTDDGYILVYVTNQKFAWVDEDGAHIADEDLAWISQCGEIYFEWWISEDESFALMDEDETVLVSEQ